MFQAIKTWLTRPIGPLDARNVFIVVGLVFASVFLWNTVVLGIARIGSVGKDVV